MPDISMCLGHGCKLKERCYRYTATPNEYRQAYADFDPGPDGDSCEWFWPNDNNA